MLSKLPVPAIIAHRGSSAHAPENTLAAFRLAIEQGADGIELDARLTSDNQVVVFHDLTLDRITSVKGRVNRLTLADLQNLDAGSHFNTAFRGEKIPSLDDVLRTLGQSTFINIELKNHYSIFDPLPNQVAKLINRYDLQNRAIISSFNPIPLIRIRHLLPNTPTGLLSVRGTSGLLVRKWIGRNIKCQSFHIELNDITPALINHIHQKGILVLAYTVNQEEEMRNLFKMGVDGIITKDPIMARQTLNSIQLSQQ